MEFAFMKYQGTGNDFIMVNDPERTFPFKQRKKINELCNRRFGIGADGLIALQEDARSDFRMRYFNADGREGSMCGNGGRCAVAFAHRLGRIERKCRFMAVDGEHEAEILEHGIIRLGMRDVNGVARARKNYILNTGSPHYVLFVEHLADMDVFNRGRNIRHGEIFREEGINVNFAEAEKDALFVRTYERGVEDETYSCGTGVVAAALAAAQRDAQSSGSRVIRTIGGTLKVRFERTGPESFRHIWLEGPAEFVFEGVFNL